MIKQFCLNFGFDVLVLGLDKHREVEIEIKLLNVDEKKFLKQIKLLTKILKKYNIFFSICEYKGCDWLRAIILNPFISAKHIFRIFKGIDDFYNIKKQNNKKVL